MRSLVAVAAGALALVAAAPAGAQGRCTVGDLHASLGRQQVAAGNIGAVVTLRNRSSARCTLRGYAGFGLLDRHRRDLPTNVMRGSTQFGQDPGPRRVVLRPGGRAYAILAWSDVPGRGEPVNRQCEPTAAFLEVTPPNAFRHRTVRFGSFACEHGRLTTTAFSARRPAGF